MEKIDTFFIYIPPYLPQCFGFHMLYPCFQGTGGGLLFHSILFKVAIMLDNLEPPPPPQKKYKKGKMPRFGLLAALLLTWLGVWWGGEGCCFKIVDQTRKCMTVLQPSATSEDCQNNF